ncbi:MAG: hypothetical protein MI864_17080 [Pseudomonadales bacterium]|nr:hypothetical protein [Pseudomonadales bacterium]
MQFIYEKSESIRAGISVRTIQRIESGQSCSLDTLKSVSAAMDLKHFSELLPLPKKREYRPTPVNLLMIALRELIFKNIYRASIITFFSIGLFSFINAVEMSNDRYAGLSVEDRIQAALETNRAIKQDHPLFVHRTEEEIISNVHSQIEWESKPFSASDWQKIINYMIQSGLVFLLITTFYGVYRVLTTYEFDELIGKRFAGLKFGKIT